MIPLEIPKVNVNGLSFPQIVLGHDPFIGFTSLYPKPHEKLQRYQTRFSKGKQIIDFLSSAVQEGIDVISFGVHEPKNVIEAEERVQKRGLRLFPIIYQVPLKLSNHSVPVRRVNATLLQNREQLKDQALYMEYVSTPEFKRLEQGHPLSIQEQRRLTLDVEKLLKWLKWFGRHGCINMVMTMIEFFATADRFDLLDKAVQIFNQLGFSVCAGSHTADAFPLLERAGLHFPAYYAPFNKIGFFMFPNQRTLEKCLVNIREPIIAIKPLAGGRISPKAAFEYIYRQKKDTVSMIGLSSVQEIRETVTAFQYVYSML